MWEYTNRLSNASQLSTWPRSLGNKSFYVREITTFNGVHPFLKHEIKCHLRCKYIKAKIRKRPKLVGYHARCVPDLSSEASLWLAKCPEMNEGYFSMWKTHQGSPQDHLVTHWLIYSCLNICHLNILTVTAFTRYKVVHSIIYPHISWCEKTSELCVSVCWKNLGGKRSYVKDNEIRDVVFDIKLCHPISREHCTPQTYFVFVFLALQLLCCSTEIYRVITIKFGAI